MSFSAALTAQKSIMVFNRQICDTAADLTVDEIDHSFRLIESTLALLLNVVAAPSPEKIKQMDSAIDTFNEWARELTERVSKRNLTE